MAIALAESLQRPLTPDHSFVDLSQVRDPALVWPSVARALGLRDEGQEHLCELIQRHLTAHQDLVVLDNLEQVLDIAPALAELLASCANVRLIATSREPLRIRAERTFESLRSGYHDPPRRAWMRSASRLPSSS